MRIEFIKKRYYKGREYIPGDIIEMEKSSMRTYLNLKAVKVATIPNKINLDEMTYKQLQLLCKKNNLPAVGKKEDLIISLKEKGV